MIFFFLTNRTKRRKSLKLILKENHKKQTKSPIKKRTVNSKTKSQKSKSKNKSNKIMRSNKIHTKQWTFQNLKAFVEIYLKVGLLLDSLWIFQESYRDQVQQTLYLDWGQLNGQLVNIFHLRKRCLQISLLEEVRSRKATL